MNDYTLKIVEFEDDLTNIFVSFKQLPIEFAYHECGSAHFHVQAYSTKKI